MTWVTAFLSLALAGSGTFLIFPADEGPKTCPGHRDDPREQIVGTEGDDVLTVPEGAIGCGLEGDDVLRADPHGDTRLFGGPGDDTFCSRNRDFDRVFGGDGEDRAVADEDDTVRDVEGDGVMLRCRLLGR